MPEDTKGIFISYRRDDSGAYAGRIADAFSDHFGEDRVFRDIDSIEPSLDFSEVIERAVGSSEVLIAVIGRNWATATDATGHKRLENPDDYVRLEIVAALQRNIRVIPVLVQGASMPSAQELPDELAPLARRNAFELHDDSWRGEVERLITTLDRVLDPARNRSENRGGAKQPRAASPRPPVWNLVGHGEGAPSQPDIISPETIFISYSRKDWDDFVEPLVIELRQKGLKVWIDQQDIRSGTDWADTIQEALDICQRMVICVSPNSMNSPQAKNEYRYFLRTNKTVVPLVLREAKTPYDLSSIQFVPYRDLTKLIEELVG